MEKSSQLIEKIEKLQNLGVGDTARLEHIRNCITTNKKIYNSDFRYVDYLDSKTQNNLEAQAEKEGNFCWRCSRKLMQNAQFCAFCGVDQNKEFHGIAVRKKIMQLNPITIISNLHSYQILAVIGGFFSLIPILFAITNLGRIFEIVEFYFGVNLSGYSVGFTGLGAVSASLCILVMTLPFLIKKSKKVGKILFFSSFGILVLSLFTGAVGFVMVLFAGMLALKQRRY